MTLKIAPEGIPFIIGSIVPALAVYLFTKNWSALPLLLLVLFMIFFFRDPERAVPSEEGIFVAPADGRVIAVKDFFEPIHLKKKVKRISIFMSPLNVHINRSPADGRVLNVIRNRGNFKAAYKDEAAVSNENTVMLLETEYGTIAVRQVAGFIARRIVCRVKPGDQLLRGQRYGLIKFSSRVDVFLPEDADISVSPDDGVTAGETVIARIPQ